MYQYHSMMEKKKMKLNSSMEKLLHDKLLPVRRRDKFIHKFGICSRRELDNFYTVVEYTMQNIAKFMNAQERLNNETNRTLNENGYNPIDFKAKEMFQ